jgi:hypothetical protein
LKLLEGINSLLLLENSNHIDGLSLSLLEGIGIKSIALSKAHNSLLSDVEL